MDDTIIEVWISLHQNPDDDNKVHFSCFSFIRVPPHSAYLIRETRGLFKAPSFLHASLSTLRRQSSMWSDMDILLELLQLQLLVCGLLYGSRDWHGFGKPMGKCRGLAWGTGTGWVYPTLTKPIPAMTGWRVSPKLKLCLERDHWPQAHSFDLHQCPLSGSMASETWKRVSESSALIFSWTERVLLW